MNTIDKLLANGWKEYPDAFRSYQRSFYKRFETPTRCALNDDKPGIQIALLVGKDSGSLELELIGGLKDESWICLHNYALPNTYEEVEKLIPRLLAVWEAANSTK